jgi:hypothetical protein
MGTIIALIVGAVAVGLLGFLGYISYTSILQARVLSNPVDLDRLKDFLDQQVAVHGEPEIVGDGYSPYGFPVLWYKQEDQVYRRSGKSGSWRTVNTDERGFDFHLHFPGGGRILVQCAPTEVHGGESSIEKEGFFSNRRTRHAWLPVAPAITALGKLVLSGDGGTLVPDERIGMLLSTNPPQRAAFWEYAKGFAGLVFIALILIGGIAVLIGMR